MRLAFKNDIKVIGGSEKLFKYFIKHNNPNNIISYCDISKFNGDVYLRLGFKTSISDVTPPNYMWINSENKMAFPRYKTMKHKLIQQGLGTKEDTENSIMEGLGYKKMYDCGNLRFTWRKE